MSVTKAVTTWPVFILLMLIMALPVYGPMMTYVEGTVFPVASKITIVSQKPAQGGGLDITFTYTKYRFCELMGFDAKAGQLDVPMDIAPENATTTPTRAPGAQISRVWHIAASTLDGLQIWFIHRCSPLWLTATLVYP